MFKNEILSKYEKNNSRENITIKEHKYYELTKYDNKKKCRIARNSYIKITSKNKDIYLKPICGTRNQIHNSNENCVCYLCDNNLN